MTSRYHNEDYRFALLMCLLLLTGCSSTPQPNPYQAVYDQCVQDWAQSPEGRRLLLVEDPSPQNDQNKAQSFNRWQQMCYASAQQMQDNDIARRNQAMFGAVMGQQMLLNNNRLLGYDRGY